MRRRLIQCLLLFTVGLLGKSHVVCALRDTALEEEDIDSNADIATTIKDADNSQHQQRIKEEEKKLWGATQVEPKEHAESLSSEHSEDEQQQHKPQESTKENNPSSAIPFVGKTGSTSHAIPYQYEPPKGFEITARVYTDPHDKLAHFDNDGSIVFPYWECGVTGSSTVPIPLQHATVRHLLGGSKPNLYSGEEFGPYPQLVIALSPLEVLLNSGQAQTFAPGDVLLLEDVISGGHKLKGSGQSDMTVMILTLPDHYHHVGKDKHSLKRILAKAANPCPDDGWQMEAASPEETSTIGNKVSQALEAIQPRSIRRYALGMVGLSISTLLGDFMGKVAPLWLAVVFGGGCFVAGGTYSFVKIGDYCLDELEMWQERRQLQIQGVEKDGDGDDVPIEKNLEDLIEKKGSREAAPSRVL